MLHALSEKTDCFAIYRTGATQTGVNRPVSSRGEPTHGKGGHPFGFGFRTERPDDCAAPGPEPRHRRALHPEVPSVRNRSSVGRVAQIGQAPAIAGRRNRMGSEL